MTTTIAGIIRSGKLELLDEPLGLRDGRVTVTIDVEPTTQSEMARVDRREFLRLPLLERRRILKDQADKLASHYERDGEWTEWLAG